jgi:hypothetical protein
VRGIGEQSFISLPAVLKEKLPSQLLINAGRGRKQVIPEIDIQKMVQKLKFPVVLSEIFFHDGHRIA